MGEQAESAMKSWHLYVLGCSDGTLYTGVTTDLQRRLVEHNSSPKGAKYTMTRRPVHLLWSKQCGSRSEAQSEEYKFKKLSRKNKLKEMERGEK